MKENNNERSVADVLRDSMIGLKDSDIGVYQKVIELAEAGFFEQHQTAGNLRVMADTLIAIPANGGVSNEGK